jgi:hypothetical protein
MMIAVMSLLMQSPTWLDSADEARRRAAAEDRPLLVYSFDSDN